MPEHLTWANLYLTSTQAYWIMGNKRVPHSYGPRRDWAPMWVTNVERLDANEPCIYLAPPDYPHVAKFTLEWGSTDQGYRLFSQRTGKSRMYVLCKKMVLTLPVSKIPISIVLDVSKPCYDCPSDSVAFEVHNMAGNAVGTYLYDASKRVTISMLKNDVVGDINYNPSKHQVVVTHLLSRAPTITC